MSSEKERLVDVYVINLDRREDRLAQISNQIRECGLALKRIPAVDASLLDESHSQSVLSRAYTANWMSHRRALEAITNSDEDFGVVLEDDADLRSARISSEKLIELSSMMKRNGLDLLQIGYISSLYKITSLRGILEIILDVRGGRFLLDGTSKTWVVKKRYRAGSHCYIVTKSMAGQLISLNTPPALATDPFYMALAENSMGPQIARLAKSLVEQKSRTGRLQQVDSDLESRE